MLDLETVWDYSIQAIVNDQSSSTIRTYPVNNGLGQLHGLGTNLNLIELRKFLRCSPFQPL